MTTMSTMLVTDAELALALTSSSSSSTASSPSCPGGGGRFGTSYVGCRRVRPSSRSVRDALRLQKENKKKKRKNNNNNAQHQQQPPPPPLFGQDPKVETTTTNDAASNNNNNNNDDDDLSTTRKMEATTTTTTKKKKKKKKKRPRHDDETTARAASDDEHVGGTTDDEDDDESDESDDDDEGYYRFPAAEVPSLTSSSTRTRHLQEEVADLAGEREGVPPVALPYSMMRLAVPTTLLLLSSSQPQPPPPALPPQASADPLVPPQIAALWDEELSQQWAHALKITLKEAERLRDQDDRVRKLPYVLEPEPWTRKRPRSMLTTAMEGQLSFDDDAVSPPPPVATSECVPAPPPRTWFACRYDATAHPGGSTESNQQHGMNRRAVLDAAVVQCLHYQTHLHVGCGAKFGCDYLLYEGSRRCFHAFAGVRVVVTNDDSPTINGIAHVDDREDDNVAFAEDPALPLPTPYDMAGYVRGLNTAGKLALLATAIREAPKEKPSTALRAGDEGDAPPPTYRVAIVDLALKKVRATTFRGASGTVTPKMLPKRPGAEAEAIAAAVTGVGAGAR